MVIEADFVKESSSIWLGRNCTCDLRWPHPYLQPLATFAWEGVAVSADVGHLSSDMWADWNLRR